MTHLLKLPGLACVLLLCGCVATGNKPLAAPVTFILDREISWSARAPLGFTETYFLAPGRYTSTRRDDDGYYLLPPAGAFRAKIPGEKDPVEIKGGVYLPDDPSKGINVWIFDPGMTTAVSGIVMSKPPSGKMIRMRQWGPPELVREFTRSEKAGGT